MQFFIRIRNTLLKETQLGLASLHWRSATLFTRVYVFSQRLKDWIIGRRQQDRLVKSAFWLDLIFPGATYRTPFMQLEPLT
ncbi:hypothetical protein BC937DRAFT_89627 [Endogone sp. FLAS-F59071]|nr:hypothetical protein BC937DRAFT_89627 [Endogone sp. FLAS-F59071]|eukprot:RUS22354.1 hypothetical protein BC937DRAFT_89627 [Endogone sp. FLAS-F59071]